MTAHGLPGRFRLTGTDGAGSKRRGRAARWLSACAALFLCAPLVAHAVPNFDAVRGAWRSSEGLLLDRHGRLLDELRVDDRVRKLSWVRLENVSPAVVVAVVHAEDKRFFEHGGVDWRALGDAAIDTLLRGSPRGASTLTMQVAAMLDPALKPEGSRRSVMQKVEQIREARELEHHWSKRQILEAHLNLSTFRGEYIGIDAAARGLFQKDPSGIETREGAILAALLRGPNASPAVVARRACVVAAAHDCRPFEKLASEVLGVPPRVEPKARLAPLLARLLLSRDARRVQTTLDAAVQAHVIEVLRRQITNLAGRNVHDAAALVLDNATGDVLAYVGNTGSGSSAQFVDGVKGLRQAGSTLKPFLYGKAIEDRLLTAASVLDDSPANLVTPGGLYVPQNYDHTYRGPVSVRVALSGSLNIPAVRTLMLVGTEPFVDRLRAFGFDDVVESGDFYGYSLALGSADVTLWQLTAAYRALAAGGDWVEPRVLPGDVTKPVHVMGASAAWIIADILSDRGARSQTFGLENPLVTRFWTAVKTGTSKDMRDNWCVGFSRRYTVGVWVGNFDGSPMQDVSGISGAAPAWWDIMQFLHETERRLGPPPRPPDVLVEHVDFSPPFEPARDEVFLRGTEVPEVVLKPTAVVPPRIAYPGEGVILAVDPDIPEPVERVLFRASEPRDSLRWRLNDEVLPDTGPVVAWEPRPGRFELALIDADGQVLDSVHFEVRGAPKRLP
ncbi:MAG: penicillin-binding protein 1C [Betaproteobacteria bacterium]|nr:penicillin-binding protein 1C [Betaproteobacteria bacterium]